MTTVRITRVSSKVSAAQISKAFSLLQIPSVAAPRAVAHARYLNATALQSVGEYSINTSYHYQ